MNRLLPDNLLSQVSDVVADRLGLYFPKERWDDLERGIKYSFLESEYTDLINSVESLIYSSLSKKQLEILSSHLTVGETYFFRDKKFFEVLESQLLKDLINSKRGMDHQLRIWSAGSCTGEEPYSIAILLKKILYDLKDWNITLLASDINSNFLKKMEKGIYSNWSFRDVAPEIKQKYFIKTDDERYKIDNSIKKIVTASYLNLAEDSYPSLLNNTNAMDIIVCRNVLMYFTQEKAKKVIQGFYRSLVEGGWLIVSPTETSQKLFEQFESIQLMGVMLYKKVESLLSQSYIIEKSKIPFEEYVQFIEPQTTLELQTPELFQDEEVTPQINEQIIHGMQQPNYEEAYSLYKQGLYSEAKKKLEEYLSSNYDDSKAHALLARIYANLGKLREAFAWCEKAISTDKLNHVYHFLMAEILQEQEQFIKAETSLKRSIYLDHNFVTAHIALGNINVRLNKIHEAEKNYKNALILLQQYNPDTIIPETDGITAERLTEIIQANNNEVLKYEFQNGK